MKYVPFVLCFCFLFVVGCNEMNPKGQDEVQRFVRQWNDAHTQLKAPYLKRYYMDVVTYYGEDYTKNQVQEDKNLLFQQFPDYTQQILNNQLTISKEAGSFLVTFTKHVKYNQIETNYVSYLSVINKNGAFKILREGVNENDKNSNAPIFPNAREQTMTRSNKRQLFGDFDGDGLSDYATVISPEIVKVAKTNTQNKDSIVCKEGCNSTIFFSSKTLKPITIKNSYQSELENLKDLNSDGTDEIGFWNIKPTTKSLFVFNPSNGTLLTEPIVINTSVHKNLNLIDVFKKTGPNKITVTQSAQVNGKWILKSEIITLE